MQPEIEHEISRALKRRRLSSSAELEGFVIDAHHFLSESGVFANVKVKKTGDSRAAVVITCSVADSLLSVSDVVAALERIWTEELA